MVVPLTAVAGKLLEATVSTTGDEYLRALVRAVAAELGTEYAFVGELAADSMSIATCAVFGRGEFGENFEYALAGTPCENAVKGPPCCYPADVQRLFPDDALLGEMGAESYLGLPVRTASGETLGVLAAIGCMRFEPPADLEPVLELFASRAAAELLRLRYERALAASESRYRQIVETCLEGVWTLDAEGRTTFVNRQMARMLGYRPEEMIGREPFDFMDDEARRVSEVKRDLRLKGVQERYEFRFRHRDGSDVWALVSATPFVDGGHVTGTLALIADVTRVHGLEERVAGAERLESLGQAAGGIAHDFNNLLVGILGNVELATEQVRAAGGADGVLADAEAAAREAAELSRELLTYSGRGRFPVAPVEMAGVLRTIVGEFRAGLPSGVELTVADGGPLPLVIGDAAQLRRVISALVENAAEALQRAGGSIRIASGTIEIDAAATASIDPELTPGEFVYVDVTDDGRGIPKQALARLFDPAFSTKSEGRGLGLAEARGILRSHVGGIQVESRLGEGARFRVLLPVAREARAEPAARVRIAGRSKKIRRIAPESGPRSVLLVEDEAVVRRTAGRVLELGGFSVLEAADGATALRLFEEKLDKIVLAVVDYTMPGMKGDELIAAIRALAPELPVVLTSGYGLEDLGDDGSWLATVGFVHKPWTPSRFMSAIAGALGVEVDD